MQQSLFEEENPPTITSNINSLKINTQAKTPLSKSQIQFNDLTHKIELLENKIVAENERLNKLLSIFHEKVSPLVKEYASNRFKIALALDASTANIKFSKKQIETIRFVIISICDSLFQSVIPNDEQKALYDRWAETSYDAEMETLEEDKDNFMNDFFSSIFGEEFNFDDFENDPDSYEQKMKEKFDHQNHSYKGRKKTAKQLEKESLRKAEQASMEKSIRSIYLTLAKMLHPDLETEEALKSEKDELMKKVTAAYEQKDITTLLRLEMEWVHKTSEHLEKLTEEKLKVYIAALKKQAAELQHEYRMIIHNPKFGPIMEYAGLKDVYAMRQIQKTQKEIKDALKGIEETCSIINRPNSKKQIISFIQEYKEYIEDQYYESIWQSY